MWAGRETIFKFLGLLFGGLSTIGKGETRKAQEIVRE